KSTPFMLFTNGIIISFKNMGINLRKLKSILNEEPLTSCIHFLIIKNIINEHDEGKSMFLQCEQKEISWLKKSPHSNSESYS
ncbi:MAG TPA: hypothetical protein VIG43_02815, partial [Kurthia sp.]